MIELDKLTFWRGAMIALPVSICLWLVFIGGIWAFAWEVW
jgi:hypothetical protein